jgi:short-subunit dehydrogenase
LTAKQWVLITGATSGIGLATALLLALEGYQVIATGRSEEKLNRIQTAADKAKVTIRRILADVTEADSIANLHSEVLAMTDGYGVDVLVNNAGYAEGGAMEEIPIERVRKQFETNVIGLIAVTQTFLPEMRHRQSGKIVNISSVVGKVTIPLLGAYTATKHAVESLTDAMRMELKHSGIQVIAVAPGSISTNFGSTLVDSVETWMSPDSPYKRAYSKFLKDRNADGGAEPMVIASAILKAIQAKNPKARYAAPFDSKVMPAVKGLFPTKTLDKVIIRTVMGKSEREK